MAAMEWVAKEVFFVKLRPELGEGTSQGETALVNL